MIQLITYPPAFGLFASSPFCVKVAYLLNMAGLEWERVDLTDPRKMPFGKLPVIRDEGRLIADSDTIQIHLQAKGCDFDKGLSDLDRANARAFTRMIEEHLYFHIVLDRWGNDEIWPKVREIYFAPMPPIIRTIVANGIRKNTLRGLNSQGMGRLNEDQRAERIMPDLEAITTRLWQGPFLFGSKVSSADAAIAPMLEAAIVTPGDTKLKALVSSNEVLTSYVSRVKEACG